jgi:alanine dehydrogenase
MALLIKSEDLKGLISIEEAIAAVKAGFRDQGEKPAYSAPRIRIHHEDRRVTVHPGGCHTLGVAGMFIHVERFTFHGGAQQYERAGKRVYVAYDSETAELKTIIIGSLPLFAFDSEEDMFATETAITSSVGTDMLARRDCRVLGLYGTGRQARRHLIAMCTIRPGIETVRVFSRSEENRRRFAAEMRPFVRAKIEVTSRPQDVAIGADLICCATGSNVPVLSGAWLERGQHVTSIVAGNKGVVRQGSVPRPRREFDDEVIARADVIVATLKEQAIMDEQGDLFEPVAKGITSWDGIADLGELAAGKAHGRRRDDEITVFKQNSDQGVGFMALAKLAHDKARAHGVGMEL